MKSSQKRLNDIIVKLRQHKFRITPQRLTILKVFLNSTEHPSVERVYEQVIADFPTTSLATVYKTVNLLKKIGEILEIGFADGRNRYDGNKPYPHPHLICMKCKTIMDPEVSNLDHLTAEVEQASGYRILSHQLEFFGICPACQNK
ncbi:MAG: transcriptional repressor [Desulfuromonadales bacterium C00003107]|nr:MAG: transcriptional repressor [Desulfuromonadales bacterium C00003107]